MSALWLILATLSAISTPDYSGEMGLLRGSVHPVQPGAHRTAYAREWTVQFKDCPEKTVISSTLFTWAMIDAARHMQVWLNSYPLVERKLFLRHGELLDAVGFNDNKKVRPAPNCTSLELNNGYELTTSKARIGNCSSKAPVDESVQWFVQDKTPTAAVHLSHEAEKCLPKVSGLLFDPQGHIRLAYAADFSAAVKATLWGSTGQCLDFEFDSTQQLFHTKLRSCRKGMH